MRREKNRLYKVAKLAQNDNEKLTVYKTFKNNYKELIEVKKYQAVQRKFDAAEGDQKRTWKVLNSLLNNEESSIDQIDCEGEIIENEVEIANKFNEYFVKAVRDIHDAIPNVNVVYDNHVSDNNNVFKFKKVGIRDVKKYLTKGYEQKSIKRRCKYQCELFARCGDFDWCYPH